MSISSLWVEKYRPCSLDEIVGQDGVVERLKAYVRKGNVPHLLFAGPPGVGKTATTIALSRELFGEEWGGNFSELNASDERGIDVVRTKIKDFARTAPLGEADFKIIFLDEADSLTSDAQSALRRTMERYSGTCRFVLSCNYSSKIIEPIQSRCTVFRFRPIQDADLRERLTEVADAEGMTVSDGALDALEYVANGDLRRGITALQSAAAMGPDVGEDDVYRVVSATRPEKARDLLVSALKGDFSGARDLLDELLIDEGLSGDDMVRQLHRTVFDLSIPDREKARLVDRIGEAEFRIVEGANPRIQLEGLLAHLALNSSGS
ncbi:MAG: Replication factor C small subunit [Methanonatronarchaeales archaeon]|nr:Replication factor C small subunit [Methanonatronarchaeales archaeon]